LRASRRRNTTPTGALLSERSRTSAVKSRGTSAGATAVVPSKGAAPPPIADDCTSAPFETRQNDGAPNVLSSRIVHPPTRRERSSTETSRNVTPELAQA
jgi:hypothetical protein